MFKLFINKIVTEYYNINNKVKRITKILLILSFILLLISSLFLCVYSSNQEFLYTYYIGILLFKSSIFYISFIIICSIAFNKIYNDLNLSSKK